MASPVNSLDFADRGQWRQWLEKNHDSAAEAWVIHYKKKYRDLGLTLDEAVEEALCFGWIDSTLNRVDEKRYALRYTPRRKDSIWSVSNIGRVENLIAKGKMTQAGQRAIDEAKANGQWQAAKRREQVDIIPPALERELQKHEGALEAYKALSNSRKKQIIYWLESAKREETKQRRIQKIVDEMKGVNR